MEYIEELNRDGNIDIRCRTLETETMSKDIRGLPIMREEFELAIRELKSNKISWDWWAE